MPLIADRFVVIDAKTTLDLADGQIVAFLLAPLEGDEQQRRWALRCDTFHRLHHPAIARLIDYGVVGTSHRFEAWRCGEPWAGSGRAAEQARQQTAALMRACGYTIGSPSDLDVRQTLSGPVVLPGAEAGYPHDGGQQIVESGLDVCGILTLERRAVRVLSELFDRSGDCRPRIAAMWGPPGAGKDTAIDDLARIARSRGFIPLSTRLLSRFSSDVAGRSLFLIDVDGHGLGWNAILQAVLKTPQSHVLLFAVQEEVAAVDGIALETLSEDALIGALFPAATTAIDIARARRLAAHAAGWPGRFTRRLWAVADGHQSSQQVLPRASERPAMYGVERADSRRSDGESVEWPAGHELVSLRQRMAAGVRLLEAGRHAPGERLVRRAIGGLVRRRDWADAGQGSVALVRMLMQRGRLRDAQSMLQEASEHCRRTGERSSLADVATQHGEVLTSLGRLDAAEAVLSTAIAALRADRDGPRLARAVTAMARTLFWGGRYADGERVLRDVTDHDRQATDTTGMTVRIAVGMRAFDVAVARAVESLGLARRSRAMPLIAAATYSAAFAHLTVGDFAAVEREVAECLVAARATRDPLLATRSRLLLVEALRRSSDRAAASRLLSGVDRVPAALLPPIVRVRRDLMHEALAADAPVRPIVERYIAATGLKALSLYVGRSTAGAAEAVVDPMIDDIVDILNVCQTSDDDRAILLEVCRRTRARLHAACVGLAVAESGGYRVLASDGGRLDTGIVERAVTAGATIAPHRGDGRIEAAAPVRYGGIVIGALAARWIIATPHDTSGAAPLLTAAAAAVGPVLSAAIARRARPSTSPSMTLVGVSDAIASVREAVERAAPAPFAVLIEGESGSGKELVARALHRSSIRRDRPFCTLNCAALPDDLVEAELFGHARGAFTGAVADRPGVFEEAHGGTLFLDEIGELTPRAQAKLLRVIQEGELRRIGENLSRRVDVRIVSATNRDLRQEVASGRFRLDLLYRLDVIRIVVPPLRDRREDIAILAALFWRDATERVGSRAMLASAAVAALVRYDWPGNVRELQNVLSSLAVRAAKRGVVPPTALGPVFGERRLLEASRLDEARRTFEKSFVQAALVRTGGHRGRAAEELGVTRQGLAKLMTRLGIVEEPQRVER
jgi:DNA-binding NtrC family response regulator/tetratricopeptide (TPR) repeat protein